MVAELVPASCANDPELKQAVEALPLEQPEPACLQVRKPAAVFALNPGVERLQEPAEYRA